MKKSGFTIRASILLYVFCAFLVGTFVNNLPNTQNESVGAIILFTFSSMAIGIVIASLSAAFAGVFRALIWKLHGFTGTPFVVLGLLVSQGGVKLASDISMMFETFFPSTLLKALANKDLPEDEAGRKVNIVEKTVFVFSLILPVFFIVLAIMVRNTQIAAGGVMGIVTLFILSKTRGGDYHGALVKCEYISAGHGVYYYLRSLAAFRNDLGCFPQRLAEIETETYEARVFDTIALTCWQAVYFVKCLGEKIELDSISEAFIRYERMYGFNYRELNATRKRINLNHLFCCYMLITGTDEEKADLIDEYYDSLTLGDSKAAVAVQKEIDWHRDLLAGENTDLSAYPIFHPIDYIRWFPNYSDRYDKIKDNVISAL